jgi:DNA polymerase II small subunit/DNA polymerase delta subunit B
MFGLEKEKKDKQVKRKLFEFDLEKELKQNPTKVTQLLKEVEERIQQLKTLLRGGAQSTEFDECGVLLHGYSALERVLRRVEKKKAGE